MLIEIFRALEFFVSEIGLAKQSQRNKMMVLTIRHEEIWLRTKVTYPQISCICIFTCVSTCIYNFFVITLKVLKNNITIL